MFNNLLSSLVMAATDGVYFASLPSNVISLETIDQNEEETNLASPQVRNLLKIEA